MASQAQIEANRRNAQKSTGPKTEGGKTASKFNAVKHGMTAATSVLPHEDEISFIELRNSLMADYTPATGVERTLVETIADSYWRLLRARRCETEFFEIMMRGLKRRNNKPIAPQVDDDGALTVVMCNDHEDLAKLQRYSATIEKTYFRAIESLRKLQKDRLREERLTTAQPRQIGFVSQPGSQNMAEPTRAAANGVLQFVAHSESCSVAAQGPKISTHDEMNKIKEEGAGLTTQQL